MRESPPTSAERSFQRRYAVGAEVDARGVHFRVWAPSAKQVALIVDGQPPRELLAEGDGYFSLLAADIGPGALYRFRLDQRGPFPDPASRFQPDGPHGPSQVVDARAFEWRDAGWQGVSLGGQIMYELHIGTFTPEGTWPAALERLPLLADVGVSVIEVMPVADFPGNFGWGYDGVALFAPYHGYGTPDDFRRFIDGAHALGLGVILDVVYNHLGPDGNYLPQYSRDYFTKRYANEWGEAINFDGASSGPVREFITANAAYWIEEYHLDGLRLDATQQIFDGSDRNIIQDIEAAVRSAAPGRATFIAAENEPQDSKLIRDFELDAMWNDDLHHSMVVALTGRREAYYSDFRGAPQEFVSAAKHGFLFQGQRFAWQHNRRGQPTHGLPGNRFITYLENHDQVANSATGARMHQLAAPGMLRAMTALLLLGPETPLLFQGQEFAASARFLFFADHNPELAAAVAKGRAEFMTQFPSVASGRSTLAVPHATDTFEQCRLDWSEREKNESMVALHRDLIALRKQDAVISRAGAIAVDGAVLSADAFVLRYDVEDQSRLLIVNLGPDLSEPSFAEPLLAPPSGTSWTLLWSSEDPRYGGGGLTDIETADGWRIPGYATVALIPRPHDS